MPYRFGNICYRQAPTQRPLTGQVKAARGKLRLAYRAVCASNQFASCEPGSRDEWLMERYTAFNATRWGRKFFRVWHPPWPQCRATVKMEDISLLTAPWPWFAQAECVGANYSPGLTDVWMGRPHLIDTDN